MYNQPIMPTIKSMDLLAPQRALGQWTEDKQKLKYIYSKKK
jgi:hypothetical protein